MTVLDVPSSTFSPKQRDALIKAFRPVSVSVDAYGATGDGTTDDTTAIRSAAAAFLALSQTIDGNSIVAATLVFRPGGVYKITGSINLQSLGQSGNGGAWEIDMRGAVLYCAASGKTIFDCLGARFGVFRGGLFIGDTSSIPAIGIQVGRLSSGQSSGEMAFENTQFIGKWSRAAVFLLGSEINSFNHLYARNTDTAGGVAVQIDGCNHVGAITDFTASTLTADTAVSTTQNTFLHADLRVPSGGAPCLDAYAVTQVKFYNSFMAGTGSCIKHTAVGAAGATISDLWYDVHCELNADNIEFVRTTAGNIIIERIHVNDIASQATNSIIKKGTNVTTLYIHDHEIHLAGYTGTIFSAAVINGGSIQGHDVSYLSIGDQDWTFTTLAGNLGNLGSINRAATNAVFSAARTWILPAASAVPAGWELNILDDAGGVTGVNTLTIQRASSDKINGANTYVLNAAYASVTLVSNGVSKWTVQA